MSFDARCPIIISLPDTCKQYQSGGNYSARSVKRLNVTTVSSLSAAFK